MGEYNRDNIRDMHLIKAIRHGNTEAFNQLFQLYQPRIIKIIGRYIHDQSEMLDVSQEVFLKAYRAIRKFRGESSFYTWLYRIAVNTSKNYLLAQGRRLPDIKIQEDDMEHFMMRNGPRENSTPEQLMMRDEIEDVLFDTIEHLPKDLKTAIMLREMEGMSYEEIASIMECPVGTIRSRIFRARATIDKIVQPFLRQ